MDKIEQLTKRTIWYLEVYDCMLVESGGRCDTNAYLDEHLSIALECIDVMGNSEDIMNIINYEIEKHSLASYKRWIYLEKKLMHLSHIKEAILAL